MENRIASSTQCPRRKERKTNKGGCWFVTKIAAV